MVGKVAVEDDANLVGAAMGGMVGFNALSFEQCHLFPLFSQILARLLGGFVGRSIYYF